MTVQNSLFEIMCHYVRHAGDITLIHLCHAAIEGMRKEYTRSSSWRKIQIWK